MDNDNKIWEALYTLRMIVLIEEEPQSNKYHQIMFNPKQYNDLSVYIQNFFPKNKDHKCDNPHCAGRDIVCSEKEIKLPDNIQDIHYCKGECKC